MDVVRQRVQQVVRLCLDVCVRSEYQEDVEAEFLQKERVEVVPAAEQHAGNEHVWILIAILVVEFAEAGHLFLHAFVLSEPVGTVFEM